MSDLQREIQRLSKEIRSIEQSVVAQYGMRPVTEDVAAKIPWSPFAVLRSLFLTLVHFLSSLFAHEHHALGDRAPQPD